MPIKAARPKPQKPLRTFVRHSASSQDLMMPRATLTCRILMDQNPETMFTKDSNSNTRASPDCISAQSAMPMSVTQLNSMWNVITVTKQDTLSETAGNSKTNTTETNTRTTMVTRTTAAAHTSLKNINDLSLTLIVMTNSKERTHALIASARMVRTTLMLIYQAKNMNPY